MAIRAVWASGAARALSGGVAVVLTLLLSGCPEAVTGPDKATRLLFTIQPTSTVAGLPITPAVQVTAQDARGNPAAGFTGNVTVALGTNPAGGTLSGSTTVAAVAGIATFPALSVNKSGSGYALTATASGLSGATSATFGITPGTPTQLAFTVQPSGTAAGASITPALQIVVRDAQGNTVPSFTGVVTLALGTEPAGGTLSGAPSLAAVAGVATFSPLSIDRVGSGYSFSAAATGLSSTTSASFAVTAGAATQLAFAVQPSTTTAGAGLQPAVQVTVQDALGNAVPGFTGQVSVAITAGTGRGGATLSGTKTVAPVAGVATFSRLSIDRAAARYTRSATVPGLSGTTSVTFGVVPGAASQLAFTVQPGTTTAGAMIRPAVQITARDALGNTATGFAGNMTVAIATNPAGGTLSGTTTVAAVAGVATFSTLNIDHAGSGYRLSATAVGFTGLASGPFDIIPATAVRLTFSQQPTTAAAAAAIAPPVH